MAKRNQAGMGSANRGKPKGLKARRSTGRVHPSMPEIDWDHWKAQPTVYLHEAIALSCNIHPSVVSNPGGFGWPNLDHFDERLRTAEKWARRRGGFRATPYPTGIFSVYLPEAARWILRMAAKYPKWKRPEPPEEFWKIAIEETASPASPAAPKSVPEDNPGKPTSAAVPKPTARNKTIDPRERNTLYKIILAFVKVHSYDMKQPHSAAGHIRKLVVDAQFSLDQDTIWRHLVEALKLPKDIPVGTPDDGTMNLPQNKGD
jgi:hypothetical protein